MCEKNSPISEKYFTLSPQPLNLGGIYVKIFMIKFMESEMNTSDYIGELISYGIRTGMIDPRDGAYTRCALMDIMDEDGYSPSCETAEERELCAILGDLCRVASEKGMIDRESVVECDLFDTRLMGALTPPPSAVIDKFNTLYKDDPVAATDYFYSLAVSSNYIRADRIRRDLKWQIGSEYGEIDITVNLSKPEKDPRAIAKAKLAPQTDYPKCALCHENEGFRGTVTKAARQTLRQIPFDMAGDLWYLQYSPYVYYNEHCIALSGEHRPMRIDGSTFRKLCGFVTSFPHYFIGSNADLPIVGGSILSHDHMQGGRYTFPIQRAPVAERIDFDGFSDVEAAIVKWPMSVIRISSVDKERLCLLADKILAAWRGYTDKDAYVFAETDGTPHNTVTPIARRVGERYEMDLVLRNNITTDEHPMGLYHPHGEHHNIKKENIGLIEVMGLAVLPSRLKSEIDLMVKAITDGVDFGTVPEIEKHREWFDRFRSEYEFTPENTEDIIRKEIGKTFVRVLSDAGVFKDNDGGRVAFKRFINAVNLV